MSADESNMTPEVLLENISAMREQAQRLEPGAALSAQVPLEIDFPELGTVWVILSFEDQGQELLLTIKPDSPCTAWHAMFFGLMFGAVLVRLDPAIRMAVYFPEINVRYRMTLAPDSGDDGLDGAALSLRAVHRRVAEDEHGEGDGRFHEDYPLPEELATLLRLDGLEIPFGIGLLENGVLAVTVVPAAAKKNPMLAFTMGVVVGRLVTRALTTSGIALGHEDSRAACVAVPDPSMYRAFGEVVDSLNVRMVTDGEGD